jgi:hypothetical protein
MHSTLAITNRDILADWATVIVDSVSGDDTALLRDDVVYLTGYLALVVSDQQLSSPLYWVRVAQSEAHCPVADPELFGNLLDTGTLDPQANEFVTIHGLAASHKREHAECRR